MITLNDILLVFSLFSTLFLIVTFLQLNLNRRDFRIIEQEFIGRNSESKSTDNLTDLKISVCIPMRNEEKNVKQLLPAILNQTDQNFNVFILDDQSEDLTRAFIDEEIRHSQIPIRVLEGETRPDSWLGKPWACHQLSQVADGDYYLFLDADTIPKPQLLESIRHLFNKDDVDCISIWPEQELSGFWQKQALPLVYYALLTLLPFRYIRRKPLWMPRFIYDQLKHRFAAANGQCIAFKKTVYNQIGGHKGVKSEVVEDVALARNVRKEGFRLQLYPGNDLIKCKMYSSHADMRLGFRKNFLAGFDNNVPLFLSMAIVHLIVFIMPYVLLILARLNGNHPLFILSLISISIIILSRTQLNLWYKWPLNGALFHPLGVLWFQWLGVQILWDRMRGRSVTWKGRVIP